MKLVEAKKIVDAVEAELAHLGNGFRGTVLREYTRVYPDSVTVVIEPAEGPQRASEMIRAFEKIEAKVEKKFKRHIMLVPANPEVTDVPIRIGVPR